MEGGALTLSDASRLGDLEAKISRASRAFIEAGEALKEIRDSRLYRQTYPTFEEYCEQRWNWQRRYPYFLISAAEVMRHLKMCTTVHILPTSERQVRELTRLDDPEFQVKAWEGVLVRVNGTASKITAAIVRQEVAKFLPVDEGDEAFIPPEEAALIRTFLIKRLGKWPAEFRQTFGKFVGGIVEDISNAITDGANEDD